MHAPSRQADLAGNVANVRANPNVCAGAHGGGGQPQTPAPGALHEYGRSDNSGDMRTNAHQDGRYPTCLDVTRSQTC